MLKSLELFGFKSFADRTLFEFSPGITCVVGPNGSGKSNVVDAIKWILGDQSAKSLRGKEMSDVIFNGSAGRRSSGFAEATLAFDNSQGLLPIDTREVTIGRRLYQSGDSEYLLNGAPVRLKDVRDVFMGTGAGTAAYSIIEQGRVDQILQANPATRRLVFEEAAGISKFKSRRIEAERRLERVAQNLLRLTDIVDEVESQLNATRSQASKAARFRELSQELRELWTGLAADDHRALSQKLREQTQLLSDLQSQQTALQRLIEEIESDRQQADQLISELDDKLIDHERSIARNRQSLATHQSTIHHQSQRLSEIAPEIRKLRDQRALLAAQTRELEREFQRAEASLHDFTSEYQRLQTSLTEKEITVERLKHDVTDRREDIQAARKQLDEEQRTKTGHIERLAILKSQLDSLQEQQQRAQQELQQSEDRVQTAQAERVKRQQLVNEAEQAYQSAQQTVQELQLKRSDLTEQKRLTEQRLVELKERRSADAARLSVLEELERRQEGIAIGVQEILRRAATSHFPPWNRILGTVRDLIDVPLELAPIIDAALGERAQYVATSDLAALLDYLNRGPAPIDGRVGFVGVTPPSLGSSLPSPAPSTAAESPELTGMPGVFGRADRLIADSERSPGVAATVLGDTWIVETLDDARRLLQQFPHVVGLRFVTLQGEVLTTAGELFVGLVPHESSIVSRKSELRQLRNSLHQHDRTLEALQQRQSILGSSIDSKHDELAAARQQLELQAGTLSECAALLAGQVRELERLEQEYQQKRKQVEELQAQFAQAEQEAATLREQVAGSDEQIRTIRATIEQLETDALQHEQRLQQLMQEVKTHQLEMAKQEERLANLRVQQTQSEREYRQARRQAEQLEQQFQQNLEQRQRGELEILRAEAALAMHALRLEAVLRETRQYFQERDQLRSLRKELSRQEEARHRERRRLQDHQHDAEIASQTLKHQLQGTAERIQDEFQIPLEKLVEQGASAYRIYLAERYDSATAITICGQGPLGSASHPDSTRDDHHHESESTPEASSIEESSSEQADNSVDNQVSSQPSLQTAATAPETSENSLPNVPEFLEVRDELEAQVDRLRRKIKAMGHVNTEALESLEELESRYQLLSHQLQDLQQAKGSLEDIIRKINGESERIFLETFETIRVHFQELFRKLFGGGDADIILEDPQDVLECGIDIVARPPGKELRSISLLSGGEKTMTAVGLLFAMFRSKPSPYCILDEVDAALDEANVDRYVAVVKEFVQMTQFVIITHRKRTMTAANVLYGVTMEQAGVSKRISVKFEEVNDNGEIQSAA